MRIVAILLAATILSASAAASAAVDGLRGKVYAKISQNDPAGIIKLMDDGGYGQNGLLESVKENKVYAGDGILVFSGPVSRSNKVESASSYAARAQNAAAAAGVPIYVPPSHVLARINTGRYDVYSGHVTFIIDTKNGMVFVHNGTQPASREFLINRDSTGIIPLEKKFISYNEYILKIIEKIIEEPKVLNTQYLAGDFLKKYYPDEYIEASDSHNRTLYTRSLFNVLVRELAYSGKDVSPLKISAARLAGLSSDEIKLKLDGIELKNILVAKETKQINVANNTNNEKTPIIAYVNRDLSSRYLGVTVPSGFSKLIDDEFKLAKKLFSSRKEQWGNIRGYCADVRAQQYEAISAANAAGAQQYANAQMQWVVPTTMTVSGDGGSMEYGQAITKSQQLGVVRNNAVANGYRDENEMYAEAAKQPGIQAALSASMAGAPPGFSPVACMGTLPFKNGQFIVQGENIAKMVIFDTVHVEEHTYIDQSSKVQVGSSRKKRTVNIKDERVQIVTTVGESKITVEYSTNIEDQPPRFIDVKLGLLSQDKRQELGLLDESMAISANAVLQAVNDVYLTCGLTDSSGKCLTAASYIYKLSKPEGIKDFINKYKVLVKAELKAKQKALTELDK